MSPGGALPCCHIRLIARKPPPVAYPEGLETLGDHIRKRRLDLGLLQRELGEEPEVDETAIHNWQTNLAFPQLGSMHGIDAFLGYASYDT
jgi:hypothetical protein